MPNSKSKIQKSFNYHFFFGIEPFDIVEIGFFEQVISEYFVNQPDELPAFVEQGMCDVLNNDNGIHFGQLVLNQIGHQTFFNEFDSCCVYQVPMDISGREGLYKRNFNLQCDVTKMREAIDLSLILAYQESAWKEILELDPDIFYLKGMGEVIFGAKDYNIVEGWCEHRSFN